MFSFHFWWLELSVDIQNTTGYNCCDMVHVVIWHDIIQLSDHIGWGWEYIMEGARIILYTCLSVIKFNLKNEWDSGEALSLIYY